MKKFFEFLLFLIIPGLGLGWLIYRAIWTLSAFYYTGYTLDQTNIKTLTQWGIGGVEFQEAVYGGMDTFDPYTNTSVHPWRLWAKGLHLWWAIPYIIISPGFYSALTWGKNDPQQID